MLHGPRGPQLLLPYHIMDHGPHEPQLPLQYHRPRGPQFLYPIISYSKKEKPKKIDPPKEKLSHIIFLSSSGKIIKLIDNKNNIYYNF